ncbi:UNVERIFIED_CONTAM: hypothetical protein Sindi_2905500 [Sesamum indicum]
MTPDEEGAEVPCKIDVEYEWLPPRCTSCTTMGHSTKECTINKPKSIKPPVNVYVPKVGALRGPVVTERTRDQPTPHTVKQQTEDRGTRPNAAKPSREALLEFVDITIVYGATEIADRRELWASLECLALQCINTPWLVGGDFNAVRDLSEVCGTSGDIRVAMEEFNTCLQNTALLPLPMQGEWYTWHNRSVGPRNLWKRLDRMLTNDTWTVRFPSVFYQCLTPRTSDHSPMLINGDNQQRFEAMFRRLVYAKAAELERIMLQQRAKMEWMKGGDQCSRVFFCKIAQRRTTRRILQINDAQGITITEPNAVIHEFISYYQSLLGGDRRQRVMDLRFLRPWTRHIITTEEEGHLLEPFSAEDIKKAVFDIGEDKAPGPDGYSSGFYKNAWPMVGQEVTKAVLEFFSTGKLLKQINSTILTVIPKVHFPTSVTDFCPISCCNVLYKIIAKLIVQKLSVVLDKIISPCQAAFVPSRSIGDNVMLAQELFTGYNQARLPPRCALKVDIRKAYDTVEWDFLLSVLQLFGFPEIFSRWIKECISHPPFRGLRQGDPFSPYLFVLVMEVLHMGILQLIEQDMNFAFHWKCANLRLFQLGFADWSGLRLNVEKSHIIISRSAQNIREELLVVLGLQEGHLPMRYLGLPLISSQLTIADCQPLLSKIDARINGWEGLALSYAGRVQIIKTVLVALGVIKDIEKRLRVFLWRGTGNSGYSKVAWKEICKPKEEGGLGLKDMSTLNRALMCKKLCEVIRCDRTSIWVEWLRHGRLRDDLIWTIPENRGPWGWRKILRLRGSLRSVVEYRIGNGNDFLLWKDPWHHLGPLLDRFPRGPNSLGLHESTMLSSIIYEGHWHWPLITDMECVKITHVLPRIHGGTDRIIWKDLVEDASVVFGALYDSSGLIGIGSQMLNGVQENSVGSTSSIYPTDAC